MKERSHRKSASYKSRSEKPEIKKAFKGEKVPLASEDEKIRLNRFISVSGICSRRQADELIQAGLISVNGQVVTELGVKVSRNDDIRYNGERIKSEKPVYLLLNKPKDYVTTVKDPHASRNVMNLIRDACTERIYPVGRLDRNTTGVLLFTNDGDLAKTLTHPSYKKKKIYYITLDKSLTQGDFEKILKGFDLEDGFIQADDLSYPEPNDRKKIGLEIHSGRNRIVRRIFEHLGYRVRKLDRVYFAGLTKKGLMRGKWRFLTQKEINMLKMGAYR